MLSVKHLISIADLQVEDVRAILDLAARMKARPADHARTLTGKTLAMIFEKPSLRTRVSFDVGMLQLGGHAVNLTAAEISMGKRESVADVARVLGRMVDGIMARTFAHKTVVNLAACAGVPVINGLSDLLHPCQALADMLTLHESRGDLAGARLTYVGDGNNVCHSLFHAGALLGVHVTAVVPPGYEPAAEVLEQARQLAAGSGARLEVTHSVEEGVSGVDAVYTDVWASMGQEEETAARKQVFAPLQVNARLMQMAGPQAIFLHCLPAHRGEEVTDEVCDAPYSRIFPQAENRLHAQKAVLALLLGQG